MADITVPAGLLLAVQRTLTEVLTLSPPPLPKGRYALARQGTLADREAPKYAEQHKALLVTHATKDATGAPTVQSVTLPGGQTAEQYDLGGGFGKTTPAFEAALKELNAELIPFPGIRQITHAELGACPITGAHEQVLIAAGLLEDKEPE